MGTNKKAVWDDKYLLGVRKIDKQHKKLFEVYNKLYDLNDDENLRREMKKILYEFSDYMEKHFKDEEEYMASINYPDIKKHKEIHQQIIDKLSTIITSKDNLSILKSKLKIFVKRGLVDHITDEDIKIKVHHEGYDSTDEKLYEISV